MLIEAAHERPEAFEPLGSARRASPDDSELSLSRLDELASKKNERQFAGSTRFRYGI
jgi:hypothetical protein